MELKNYVVFKVDQASYGYLIVEAKVSTPEFEDCIKRLLESQLDNSYFDEDVDSILNTPTSIIVQSDTPITKETHPELFI